jgi:hypothetical protein
MNDRKMYFLELHLPLWRRLMLYATTAVMVFAEMARERVLRGGVRFTENDPGEQSDGLPNFAGPPNTELRVDG